MKKLEKAGFSFGIIAGILIVALVLLVSHDLMTYASYMLVGAGASAFCSLICFGMWELRKKNLGY